ncbi:MAG: hypothetical protein WCC65_15560 [Pseudonocardiaceae bacterium]
MTCAERKWRRRWERLAAALPSPVVDQGPRGRSESDTALHRRRRVVAGVSLAGAGLLECPCRQHPAPPQ